MNAYYHLTLQSGWGSLEDTPSMLPKKAPPISQKKTYNFVASLALTYGGPKKMQNSQGMEIWSR